jgi:sigma-B regulation protein RsbU (phosphoserine phosphatase)
MRIAGLVGISHDITRRKQAEEELKRHTDEMETDVGMARQIQETFLPRTYPIFPRGVPAEASALRFAHRYIPTTTLGGDFFQIIQLDDVKCCILVCDVMGHGVRAGLLTALIRGVVAEFGKRAANPCRVLAEINRSLTPVLEQTGQPVFATAFFGVIDTAAATLTYSNAGHPPPLILRAGADTLTRLVPPDPEPAAGLIDGFNYTRHETAFNPGDVFLAYTDGVIETANPAGEIFGEERLTAEFTRTRGQSGAQVCDRIVRATEAYSQRCDFEDDVCIVTIESTGTTCAIRPVSYDI